jgi:hypothetical protein
MKINRAYSFILLQLLSLSLAAGMMISLSRTAYRERQKWNQQQMLMCDPWFSKRLSKVISGLEERGFHPRIVQSWRNPSRQREAFMAGTTELLRSFHTITNSTGQPRSFAADVVDDRTSSSKQKVQLYKLANENKLSTGIFWGLSTRQRSLLLSEIQSGEASETKLGWDPYHVQPQDLRISEANNMVQYEERFQEQ